MVGVVRLRTTPFSIGAHQMEWRLSYVHTGAMVYFFMMDSKTLGFYTVTLGFLLGVVGATLYSLYPVWAVWLLVLALALALIWRTDKQQRRDNEQAQGQKKLLLFLPLGLLALALGILRVDYAQKSAPTIAYENPVTIKGVVSRDPEYRDTTTHIYLQTDQEELLIITDEAPRVAYGDQLAVSGDVTLPEPFVTDLNRLFRYDGYLKARGVYRVMFFPDTVTVTQYHNGSGVVAVLLKVKHYFTAALENALPPDSAALAEGLLLGEKRALGEYNETIFRRAGIIHIVVLSGYNVMLVVAFVMFLFSFFLPPRWRFVCGGLSIAAFVIIVGASATVVRASVMAGLVLLADALGRHYAVWRALVLAAVLMVLWNPYILVYDPGFQLSFLATVGLVSIVPYFESNLSTGVLPLRFSELMLTTVAAQVAVLPLLLYQIGELSLVAVVVNALVLPMVPVAMLLSFLAGVSALFFAPLGEIVGIVAHWSLQYIYFIAEYFGSQSFAAVTVPPFPFYVVLLLYGLMGIAGWKYIWRSKEERKTPSMPNDSASTPLFFK